MRTTSNEYLCVLFLFDRVAHYHIDTFQQLAILLQSHKIELHLASGAVEQGAIGRVGVSKQVLSTERKYYFKEKYIRGWTLRTIDGLPKIIEEIKPFIVVCMGHVGNISHWWLALNRKRKGFQLVAWQCGYEYHPGLLKKMLLAQFVPRFDHHLAYHTNAAKYARQHGAAESQVTVIHNTINEAKVVIKPKDAARHELLQRHPEIGNRRILLFVGAVLAEKRVEVLIDAMGLMKRDETVLLVVGNGPHLAALKAYAAGRSDVVFAGAVVEGVGIYFDAAEMYLMPGTGGLGLNEAMAHSLPMIAGYADGSADDLVLDGQTGYRLRTCDAAEVAELVQRLLDNPVAAASMGRKGRELITGPLSFQNFVERVAAALVLIAADVRR